MITRSDWVNWKNSPTTKEYIKWLRENIINRLEGLGEGKYTDYREVDTTVGQVQGLKDAIEFALSGMSDVVQPDEEEQYERS